MGLRKRVDPAAEISSDSVAEAQAECERTARAVADARSAVVAAAEDMRMDARLVRVLQPLTGNEAEQIASGRLDASQRQALEGRIAFHKADQAHVQAIGKHDAARGALEAAQKVVYLAALGDGRAALAEAIRVYDEAVKAGATSRKTVEKARGVLVTAQTRHSIAESTFAEARERAIGAVTATGDEPAPELKTLRRDVADAADDIEIASEALSRAELAIGEPDYAERKAREAVEAAANMVLSLGYDEAFAEAQAHAARFARLAWIAMDLASATPGYGGEAHQRRGRVEVMNPGMVLQGDKGRAIANEAHAEVSAARAALLRDPQAALPSLS